ncbi:MAG: hypothetical protein ACRENK_09355 [Gemmatimonadaceae bacterium]
MASKEIRDAVGEAPERVKSAAELLTEKRVALAAACASYAAAKAKRDEVTMGEATKSIASLTVLIVDLEQEAARDGEADARKAAEARLLGIKKAYGSLLSELDEDEKRIAEFIAAEIPRFNNRYTKIAALRAEALALSDRFELDKPTLDRAVPPSRRQIATTLVLLQRGLLDHANERRPLEECEHQMRSRRTYTEAAPSEGYDIITSVGLKPFPELTERQQAVVVKRKRDDADFRQQLALSATVPSEGSTPISGGA